MEPAIRHAARGFRVTPYLHECVTDCAADLARDPAIATLLSARRRADPAGARLVHGRLCRDAARPSRAKAPTRCMAARWARRRRRTSHSAGGYLTRPTCALPHVERERVRGTYRGIEIVGPPPPSSGRLHVIQMLNILEGYDIGALGFGSADTCTCSPKR